MTDIVTERCDNPHPIRANALHNISVSQLVDATVPFDTIYVCWHTFQRTTHFAIPSPTIAAALSFLDFIH